MFEVSVKNNNYIYTLWACIIEQPDKYKERMTTRTEKDFLGIKEIHSDAYCDIHTIYFYFVPNQKSTFFLRNSSNRI